MSSLGNACRYGWRWRRNGVVPPEREEARAAHRHAGVCGIAHPAGIEPLPRHHVLRPEAEILVHHEPDSVADVADERLGLRQRGRHGLLADQMDPAIGRDPRERRVRLHRRDDVHRVRLLLVEHGREIGVRPGDPELFGARPGPFQNRIADRRHLDPRRLLPARQMIRADHPRAGNGDPQGCAVKRSITSHAIPPPVDDPILSPTPTRNPRSVRPRSARVARRS